MFSSGSKVSEHRIGAIIERFMRLIWSFHLTARATMTIEMSCFEKLHSKSQMEGRRNHMRLYSF